MYSFVLKTYKPVVLVQGILTNYTTISHVAERIVLKVHPCTLYFTLQTNLDGFNGVLNPVASN